MSKDNWLRELLNEAIETRETPQALLSLLRAGSDAKIVTASKCVRSPERALLYIKGMKEDPLIEELSDNFTLGVLFAVRRSLSPDITTPFRLGPYKYFPYQDLCNEVVMGYAIEKDSITLHMGLSQSLSKRTGLSTTLKFETPLSSIPQLPHDLVSTFAFGAPTKALSLAECGLIGIHLNKTPDVVVKTAFGWQIGEIKTYLSDDPLKPYAGVLDQHPEISSFSIEIGENRVYTNLQEGPVIVSAYLMRQIGLNFIFRLAHIGIHQAQSAMMERLRVKALGKAKEPNVILDTGLGVQQTAVLDKPALKPQEQVTSTLSQQTSPVPQTLTLTIDDAARILNHSVQVGLIKMKEPVYSPVAGGFRVSIEWTKDNTTLTEVADAPNKQKAVALAKIAIASKI